MDEDVDPAEPRHHLAHRPVHLLAAGQVREHAQRRDVEGLAYLGGGGGQRGALAELCGTLLAPTVDGHARAERRQPLRKRPAESSAGAGDERYFPVQFARSRAPRVSGCHVAGGALRLLQPSCERSMGERSEGALLGERRNYAKILNSSPSQILWHF